jgi:hypothetical protein
MQQAGLEINISTSTEIYHKKIPRKVLFKPRDFKAGEDDKKRRKKKGMEQRKNDREFTHKEDKIL